MKNFAINILVSCLVIFTVLFGAVFYLLFEFNYELSIFIYVGICYLVSVAALLGGSLVGLITSIFAIFAYAATYLYTTIQSSVYFDISFNQGLWLFLYLSIAIVVGKVGDGLNVYRKLLQKYPEEIKDMIKESSFHMNSERDFDEAMNNEMIRSRRMKACFCVATFSLDEIHDVTRVFGEKGVYLCMTKVKFYVRTIFRQTDRIAQSSPSTIQVLFPGINKDQLMKRLVHLQRQLDNSYIEYKGNHIKYPVLMTAGVAAFPEDGHETYLLRETMEKHRGKIADLETNGSTTILKKTKAVLSRKRKTDTAESHEAVPTKFKKERKVDEEKSA